MSLRYSSFSLILAATFAVLALACTHTPPGTSVELALAKRAEVVRLPPTPAPVRPVSPLPQDAAAAPAPDDRTEQVADAFSRGEFCMKTGKDQEAIAAFQEAVKLDPKFYQAWDSLAALYERSGDEKQALDAFKRAKVARQ